MSKLKNLKKTIVETTVRPEVQLGIIVAANVAGVITAHFVAKKVVSKAIEVLAES